MIHVPRGRHRFETTATTVAPERHEFIVHTAFVPDWHLKLSWQRESGLGAHRAGRDLKNLG